MFKKHFSLFIFVIFPLVSSAQVEPNAEEQLADLDVSVSVTHFPPLVNIDGETGGISGPDIDILNEIGARNNWNMAYTEVPKFNLIIKSVEEGNAEIGGAGISIKSSRYSRVDFSQPYWFSGKSILINGNNTSFIRKISRVLLAPDFIKLTLIFIGYVLFMANLGWYCERGKDSIDDKYSIGVWQAMYWVITTMTTVGYGDIAPKNARGRFLSVFIQLTGIAIGGMYISVVASQFMMQEESYAIEKPQDLIGKKVAVVSGTSSASYLRGLGVTDIVYKDEMRDAFYELMLGNVDATIGDSPIIQYYESQSKGKTVITGDVFDNENYGFAIKHDCELKRDIDRTILEMQEDGSINEFFRKWGLKNEIGD